MALIYRGKQYDNTRETRQMDRRIIAIMWSFAAPFWKLFVLAVAIILLGTLADLARPYLLKVAIDSQILTGDFEGLTNTAKLYAMTIALSGILAYFQAILLQYVGQKVIFDVRQRVYRHLIYQKISDIDAHSVGRMITRVTNDTDAVKDLYTDVLVAFASDFFILAGIIVVMLAIDWQLALVSFTVIPPMIFLAYLYQKYARQAYRLVREKTAKTNAFLQEILNGISIVKAFGRFCRTEKEYRDVSEEYLAAGLMEIRTFAIFRPMVDLIYILTVILLLWYGGLKSTYGGFEIGVIVSFLRYVEKFFWPIKDLAEKYSLMQSALAAAERIHEMLAESPAEEQGFSQQKKIFHGRLRFEDVWFAYDEPQWVLKGVSFEIRSGEFVGIAGFSGSGKTTLINLLLRFYDPQRGRITLDERDIREIPLATLRQRIGAVFQDVHLFRGTIEDNIRMYNENIPAADAVKAARIANIHEFIIKLPDGYNTQVGYQGALLSTGQRQLLSLARALAVNTDVLVLDEATSSIDSETEGMIQTALEKIAGQRTMLVIAHRLSTIQRADKIIVLHHGRILEEGTHDELLRKNGVYYRLYKSR